MRVQLYLLIAVVIGFSSQSMAQLTDDNGLITSSNWLVLGPFANPFGCGLAEDQLGNHIAPSFIGCEYPEESDEVDYDSALAASTACSPLMCSRQRRRPGSSASGWRSTPRPRVDSRSTGSDSAVIHWIRP